MSHATLLPCEPIVAPRLVTLPPWKSAAVRSPVARSFDPTATPLLLIAHATELSPAFRPPRSEATPLFQMVAWLTALPARSDSPTI